MDKIIAWVGKPIGIGIISLTSLALIMVANYNYKTKKLAELEYREEVREEQQAIIDQYQKAEDEIKDRYFDMVQWNEKVKDEVDNEIEKAKYEDNASNQSYTITATDGNASKLHE